MTRSIAIIGAGGINSWFIQHLSEVLTLFEKEALTYVKIFDNDEIEEKNLLRGNQNFNVDNLMDQKAEVLGKKFKFDFECIFITKDNIEEKLGNFQEIILGVDNNKVRKMIYEYCHTTDKYLLDLRAQGTQMMFCVLDHKKELQYYNDKYFSNDDTMERKGSCQLETDVVNDHIENANKAIAFFGAYCIYFKRLRGEKPLMDEFKIAY